MQNFGRRYLQVWWIERDSPTFFFKVSTHACAKWYDSVEVSLLVAFEVNHKDNPLPGSLDITKKVFITFPLVKLMYHYGITGFHNCQ